MTERVAAQSSPALATSCVHASGVKEGEADEGGLQLALDSYYMARSRFALKP